MRDSINLSANIYGPKSDGQYPVIMALTAYNKILVLNFINICVPHCSPILIAAFLKSANGQLGKVRTRAVGSNKDMLLCIWTLAASGIRRARQALYRKVTERILVMR